MRTRKNHRWTIKDIEFLRLMYPMASTGQIAEKMGVSHASVKSALKRFNLSGNRRLPEMFQQHFDAIRAQLT